MKLENGIKSLLLKNGRHLFFYYANNAGRGNNNVTIYLVPTGIERAGCCLAQEKLPFISKTRTSGWCGNVNFSKKVQKALRLEL